MARNYKLTSMRDVEYHARIGPGFVMYSTRKSRGKGQMEQDDGINWYDIVFQIQGPFANDWDIERLVDTPDDGLDAPPPDEAYTESESERKDPPPVPAIFRTDREEDTEAGTEDKFLPRRHR